MAFSKEKTEIKVIPLSDFAHLHAIFLIQLPHLFILHQSGLF